MTDETFRIIIVAFITGLPATIAALAGLRQSLKNGAKTDANTVLTQATSDSVDALGTVAGEIHVQTNGTLDGLREKLATARAELKSLKDAAPK